MASNNVTADLNTSIEPPIGWSRCDDCTFISRSRFEASRHAQATRHSKDRNCQVCRRLFDTPQALRQHKKKSQSHLTAVASIQQQQRQRRQPAAADPRGTRTPGGPNSKREASKQQKRPFSGSRAGESFGEPAGGESRQSQKENRKPRRKKAEVAQSMTHSNIDSPRKVLSSKSQGSTIQPPPTEAAKRQSKMNLTQGEASPKTKSQKTKDGKTKESIVYPVSPIVYPTVEARPVGQIMHANNPYSLYASHHRDMLFEALKLRCLPESRLVKVPEPKGIPKQDVKEAPGALTPSGKRRAIALDCEMVGIAHWQDNKKTERSELAEVVVVDVLTGEVLINKLVRQTQQVMNWRTRYSGITAARMSVARMNGTLLNGWRAAREELFQYIDSDTIVVGQDVRQDLQMLRLSHDRIVDTTWQTAQAVFGTPERMPRTWALKDLAKDLLGIEIQVGNKGHDCLEDTLATRDVALWCLCFTDQLTAWAEQKRVGFEKERIEREKKRKEEKKRREEEKTKQEEENEKKGKEAVTKWEEKEKAFKEHCCVEILFDEDDDEPEAGPIHPTADYFNPYTAHMGMG